MRPAQLGRLARSAARGTSAASRRLHDSAPASAAQPALAAVFASPYAAPPSSPEHPGSLLPFAAHPTPHQAFAQHLLTPDVGAGGPAPHAADPPSADADEVAARLREHLEALFSAGVEPPVLCAAPQGAPTPVPATSLRWSAQAVAARLTKHGHPDVPHTLEGALQPSEQARVIVESSPPYRLAWANPAWEALSGLEWQQVEGRPCLEAVAAHSAAAGAPGRLHALAEALLGRRAATLEYVQDGASVPVRVTAHSLLGRDGPSNRMLLVFTPTKPAAVPEAS